MATFWPAPGGGGGGGSIDISPNAPANPSAGDLWWDSDNGNLYIYYDDGTTSQWVSAADPKVFVSDTAPTGYDGQLWLDSTDGSMYTYYTDPGGVNSQWIGAVSRSGGILQVVSTTKTDTFSASVATGATTPFTGLTATITPRSTSSKIICLLQLAGHVVTDGSVQQLQFILTRDSTPIGIGDAAGSRKRATFWSSGSSSENQIGYSGTISYLDSPSTTSSITYGVNLGHGSSSTKTVYMNRQTTDGDVSRDARVISTITLMEVAG